MHTVSARLITDFLNDYELTQTEVADELGCSITTINSMASGKSKVSIPMAFALGSYFNQYDNTQDWTEKLLQARVADDAAEFMGKAERYKNLIKGN